MTTTDQNAAAQLARDAGCHAKRATDLLTEASHHGDTSPRLPHIIAEAQVHAILALAAVTAANGGVTS